MGRAQNLPRLEERFLEPEGWRWHSFEREERRIHFGCVFPEDGKPDAIVVCLPGLSEYCEKYFEVARDCLKRNLAFWVIDWMGQGYSDRYFDGSQKRHSYGFQHDVDDLHDFILGYIKHSSVRTDQGRIPLAMLGHSMGGNIGLHYLAQHPDVFECAAFTTPLLGVKALKDIPYPDFTTKIANLLLGKRYVPGGGDWDEGIRANADCEEFSHDPIRRNVHNAWCITDPKLQIGSPTFAWLYHAHQSCLKLQDPATLSKIETPCLLGISGQDTLIDNDAILRAQKDLMHSETIEFAHSGHEVLMETDDIRGVFLDKFYTLIKETIIQRPETLKPF